MRSTRIQSGIAHDSLFVRRISASFGFVADRDGNTDMAQFANQIEVIREQGVVGRDALWSAG
jgi:hypothetical protein